MANHIVLYGRPGTVDEGFPPLGITGNFDFYVPNADYSSRLQIVNSIGKCRVELIEGNLPPGYKLFVDNFTKEVVLEWPAYTPEGEERTDVPNGSFESGDDGTWYREEGWNIVASGGNDVYDGSWSAQFSNVWGNRILRGTKVPATPGLAIQAQCQIQQGASSPGAVVAHISLAWFGADGKPLVGRPFTPGNVVDRGSGGEWQPSTVLAVTPQNAAFVSCEISATRTRQNRILYADAVTWNYPWRAGTAGDQEYSITLRVWDSANRSADWSGILSESLIFLTSRPYQVGLPIDALVAGANTISGTLRMPAAYTVEPEATSPTLTLLSGTLNLPHKQYTVEPEAVLSTVNVLSGTLRQTLRSYNMGVEAVEPAMTVVSGSIRVALRQYTTEVEAVEPTLTITAGSLT